MRGYKHKRRKQNGRLIVDACILFSVVFCYATKNIFHFPVVFLALLIITAGVLVTVKIVRFGLAKAEKQKQHDKYINSGIRETDTMSGEDFEEFLAAHFRKNGYKVKTTQKTKDYGADLIIEKGGVSVAVQAKRYADKVGIKAIQEIVSAKDYYHADRTMVVTNNYFTDSAVNLAERCGVELWDRQTLINTFNLTDFQSFNETSGYKDNMVCPLCKGKLRLKRGRYGDFYGCENFPSCRYTKNKE